MAGASTDKHWEKNLSFTKTDGLRAQKGDLGSWQTTAKTTSSSLSNKPKKIPSQILGITGKTLENDEVTAQIHSLPTS